MDVFVNDVCGYCAFYRKDGKDYYCDNEDSECYGCSTTRRDCCADFEARKEEDNE